MAAVDLRLLVKTNHSEIHFEVLQDLAALVWDGAADILEIVDQSMNELPFKI